MITLYACTQLMHCGFVRQSTWQFVPLENQTIPWVGDGSMFHLPRQLLFLNACRWCSGNPHKLQDFTVAGDNQVKVNICGPDSDSNWLVKVQNLLFGLKVFSAHRQIHYFVTSLFGITYFLFWHFLVETIFTLYKCDYNFKSMNFIISENYPVAPAMVVVRSEALDENELFDLQTYLRQQSRDCGAKGGMEDLVKLGIDWLQRENIDVKGRLIWKHCTCVHT